MFLHFRCIFLFLGTVVLSWQDCDSFSLPPAFAVATTIPPTPPSGKSTEAEKAILTTQNVVTKVAVAGATGRVGRLVVQDLLDRGVSNVVAVVRDRGKANEMFSNPLPANLEIIQCDLANEKEIERALVGVDAAIWCATGFSDAPEVGVVEKVKRLLGVALTPKKSIDAVGLPAFGKILAEVKENDFSPPLPKLIMCSSAGVTRPAWDDMKKETFPGAADIPIVRLNPFGILDIKRESEEKLRRSGVNYCIVRPAGLNDDWPAGSRPVFAQGDVTVGRINRKDVASILVDCLSTPEATGKTFETIALAGYPRPVSINAALERLRPDSEGLPSMESITATYNTMQQLLPGETQNAAALAMGQTYEELDQGKTGRLGKRGEENVGTVALKPTE